MSNEVYLSYSKNNAPLARAVFKFLRSAGIPVWYDEAAQGVGSWLAHGHRAIRRARYHLLLLTDSTPANWQRAELDYSARCAAMNPELELIPLVRDGYEAGEFAQWIEHHEPQRLPADKALLDAHLRELVARLSDADGVPRPPLASAVANPYPGLHPYGINDARYFFGRERELGEALGRLGTQPDGGHRRWLRVEGQTGVGKASFARAGLVPAVVRGGVAGAPHDWRVAAFRPASRPGASLTTAMVAAFRGFVSEREVSEQLAGATGLADLIRESLPPDQGLVVVVDHLDDVLTEAAAHLDEVRRFDGVLAEAVSDFDQRFFLLTTGRSDLARELDERLPRLAALAREHASAYDLGGLTHSGVIDVLHGPAALGGRPWGEALGAQLQTDALRYTREPGRLCWTLRALWHQRATDPASYREMGGLEQALPRALQARFDTLGSDDRARSRSLFTALVGTGRGHGDHPVALTRAEAVAAAGRGPRGSELIEQLEAGLETADGLQTPLVMGARDGGIELLRLAHGSLPDLWPTLTGWLQEDRAALERRRDAEASALAWTGSESTLPGGAVLQYLTGADLPDAQRERLRASLSNEARRFLEDAERVERESRERSEAQEKASREAAEEARRVERETAGNRIRQLRLTVLLLLCAAGAMGVVTLQSRAKVADLNTYVESAQQKEAQAIAQLRRTEQRHIEAERQRKTAETQRREVERERREASRAGAWAEQSADDVLRMAVEASRIADSYFARISGSDGDYARRSFVSALLTRIEERLKENPDNDWMRLLLARQHALQGDLAVEQGAFSRADPAYAAAVEVHESLVAREAAPQFLQGLAEACDRMVGFLLEHRKDALAREPDKGLVIAQRALEVRKKLAELEPDVVGHITGAASSLADMGLIEQRAGRLEVGRKHLAEAVAMTRKAVAARSADPDLKHDLARRLGLAGDAALEAGDMEAALPLFEEGAKLAEELPRDDAYSRTKLRLKGRLRVVQNARR